MEGVSIPRTDVRPRAPGWPTQVVQLQIGRFDPFGATSSTAVRESLYGRFTVKLGVYVPEVARHLGGDARSFVQVHHCRFRRRLGTLGPERRDHWWPVSADDAIFSELVVRLGRDAFPDFEKLATRDSILKDLERARAPLGGGSPPRIVCAVLFAERGNQQEARRLLSSQALESGNPVHVEYVRRLAAGLGLGPLDC